MYGMMQKGLSHRKIAEKLNRSQRSITRELNRNKKYGKAYIPFYAQKRYERTSNEQRYQAPLKCPETFLFVREKLRLGWSPEIIAGRISYETKGILTISTECIYQYVYSKDARRYKLWTHLTSGRNRKF